MGWDATQRGASRTRNLGSSASPSASSPLRANASSAPPYGTFHAVYYRTPSASSPRRGKGSSECALCRRQPKRVDASAAAGADAGPGPNALQMWQRWAQSRCRCGSGGAQSRCRCGLCTAPITRSPAASPRPRWPTPLAASLHRCTVDCMVALSPEVGNPGPMSVP